jgi:hypothetical protein
MNTFGYLWIIRNLDPNLLWTYFNHSFKYWTGNPYSKDPIRDEVLQFQNIIEKIRIESEKNFGKYLH